MTISSEFIPFLKDLEKFFVGELKKQLIVDPSVTLINPELFNKARDMKALKDDIQLLKEQKIINPTLSIGEISNRYLGRIFALGEFIKKL